MLTLSGWHVEQGARISRDEDSLNEVLCWQDPACSLSVSQLCAPDDGAYRLRIGADLVVDIMSDGRLVTRPEPCLSQVTVDYFLADLVFPRLLAQQGSFVVHAGAVRTLDGAIMLMGNSGRGKSTLATSFDHAGFALLGDDAMIVSSLDAAPRVCPVYPSLRLNPDSIDALIPGTVTAGPARQHATKQRIDVAVDRQSEDWPLPILAIFSIAAAGSDEQIGLRRLTVAEACMFLVESSFALDPTDREKARCRLEDASALARQVPAYEIAYPRDYARLPEVRQVILDQVTALQTA